MVRSMLAHVTLTVADAPAAAARLAALFGWEVSWRGFSIDRGYTVHVRDGATCLVLSGPPPAGPGGFPGRSRIGIVAEDVEAVAKKARQLGYQPRVFGDGPDRRAVFADADGIEFEVTSRSRSAGRIGAGIRRRSSRRRGRGSATARRRASGW